MKKIIAITSLSFLVLFSVSAQTPDSTSLKAMQEKMKAMEMKMQDMQKQMDAMHEKESHKINTEKKVIIINGDEVEMPETPDFPDRPTMPPSVTPEAPPEIIIDGNKKVIIINGKKVDVPEGENSLSPEDIKALGGLDSLDLNGNYNVYESGDSVIINVGKFALKIKDDDEKNIRIIKEVEGNNPPKKFKRFDIEGGGMRLGVNNFLSDNKFKNVSGYEDLELNPGKSINVGIDFASAKFHIVKHHLLIMSGLGLDINNYRFVSDNVLIGKLDTVGFQIPNENEKITRNKLVATYAVIPVKLQFESNKKEKKSFRIGAGMRIGYLIGSHTKTVVNNDKIKKRDDFNLATFKYGFIFNIGYSWLNFYVNYDLTPMFKDGINPNVTPVAAGLVLSNF